MYSKPPAEISPECGEATRERILNAAAETFSSRGFRGATIREICRKARANVAAVKYHFGSKAELYFGVFKWLYAESTMPMLDGGVGEIHTPEQWKAALLDWTRSVLAIVLSENPRDQWKIRLFRRERSDPSEVLPMIIEQFYGPVLNRIEELICLGLPSETPSICVRTWAISTLAQCTVYIERMPPWDQYLLPPVIDRAAWRERLARHVVNGITARLSFRGHAAMEENGCGRVLNHGESNA